MNKDKVCVGIKEAAEMIGVSLPTMYKLAVLEDFPHVYVGKRIIISIEGIFRWLDKHNGERIDIN